MKAYLYRIKNGLFIVQSGSFHKYPHSSYTGMGIFRLTPTISIDVALKPGEILNSNQTVWFKERKDKEAKKLLIEEERSKISILERSINAHLRNIIILGNGIEEVSNEK